MNLSDHIRTVPDFPVPGILYYDITTLIENKDAFRESVWLLVDKVTPWGPFDAVAAPEARGFIFAAPLAIELGAGLIPIRKPGKLPYKTVAKSYELEYGTNTIQMHVDVVKPGSRILLVDDLLATGGTIDACRQLIEENGGTVVGIAFLIELLFLNGRDKLRTPNIVSLIQYDS